MKTISSNYITEKINGIAVDHSIPCKSSNYTACDGRGVSYVVMHYTANTTDKAKSNAN